MKLFLFSAVLLLVPLVFADLPLPAVKILFDGNGDYVIGEGFDAREIHYRADGDNLVFETRNNNTKVIIEYMALKKEARRQSFAVENFLYASDYSPNRPNRKFCHENSSENLRGLIQECGNQIRLRNLTEEERKQLDQLRSQQKNRLLASLAGALFKMIYDKNQIQTQSIGVLSLFMTNYLNTITNTRTIFIYSDDQSPMRKLMWIEKIRTGRSFVIEGQRPSSGDCHQTDPSDLKPVLCHGDVRVRPLNDSDKPN